MPKPECQMRAPRSRLARSDWGDSDFFRHLSFVICHWELSSNATHRPLRLDEIGLADVMAFLLVPDDLTEPLLDGFIRSPAAQQRLQILLPETEQARAKFAVGRQAEAIAMAAERLAHRRDDADLAAAVGE